MLVFPILVIALAFRARSAWPANREVAHAANLCVFGYFCVVSGRAGEHEGARHSCAGAPSAAFQFGLIGSLLVNSHRLPSRCPSPGCVAGIRVERVFSPKPI